MKNVTLVVPCFNEQDSLPPLFERLDRMLVAYPGWEVLFVNDGSRDTTAAVLETEVPKRTWARSVDHPRNLGLGAAMHTAFDNTRDSAIVCTIDCDCTYPPERVIELVRELGEADIATASPWHPSLETADVPWLRQLLSRGVSVLYRLALGRRIYTISSIFRAYRREVLDRVRFDSNGFPAVTEILVKAMLAGYRVTEVPIPLGTRQHGVSKMSVPRAIRGHLDLLAKTVVWKLRGGIIRE